MHLLKFRMIICIERKFYFYFCFVCYYVLLDAN